MSDRHVHALGFFIYFYSSSFAFYKLSFRPSTSDPPVFYPKMPQSGILYALVARGQIILAEYSGVAGNSGVIALQILEKLSTALNGDRLSYIIDNHAFHVLISNGITFVCMTEQVIFQLRAPFLQSYTHSSPITVFRSTHSIRLFGRRRRGLCRHSRTHRLHRRSIPTKRSLLSSPSRPRSPSQQPPQRHHHSCQPRSGVPP